MTDTEKKLEEANSVPQCEAPQPQASVSYDGLVSFVSDPYGITTSEIAQAQTSSDELPLDESSVDESSDESEAESDSASADEMSAASAADDSEAITEAVIDVALTDEIQVLDPAQLDRLADAIASADAETAAAAEAAQTLATETQEDSEAQLAAQIAEDQALAAAEAAAAEEAEAIDPELAAALPKQPFADENGAMDLREMESCIEALLFMVDKPMSLARLQELLGPDFSKELFEQAIESLKKRYDEPQHGIEIVEVAGGYQYRTKPVRAPLARKLAKVTIQRLSSGAMETLAIVAYKQPVLKDDIDKIRGVDSSYFIRALLDRKLIKISGRSDLPGRPMVYGTTDEFLQLFGLKDTAALPSLHEIEKMIPSSQSANPEDEDPRVKEMRKLVNQMNADTSTTLKYNPREDEKILKEIREKVNSIATSTPYLDEQREAEKQAKLAAEQALQPAIPEGGQGELALAQQPEELPPPVLAPENPEAPQLNP